jgi:hypothetical protein
VSLFGPSLHGLACLDAQDDDRRTGWRWHSPNPFKPPGAVLAAVLDTAKQARARITCRAPAPAEV